MMRTSGNALSATSTNLTLHIQMIIRWITHTFVNWKQQDEQLLALQVKNPDNYVNLQLDDDIDDIICFKKDPTQPNRKIALPESMVVDTVKWFHQVMGHPGEKRLQETLKQRYHHPKLHYHIEKLKCKDCEKYKLEGCGYDLLPKQEVQIATWEEVAINLIGP